MFLKKIASIRTNNFQDPEVATKISQLWQQQEELVEEIFAAGLPVYAVYHDYASDYKGDYSLSICHLAEEDEADFDTSDYDYEVFETSGSKGEDIYQTWQIIWQAEEVGQLTRSYRLDFEKYENNQKPVIFISKE